MSHTKEIRDTLFTYEGALRRATQSEKEGWRIPTIHELSKLYDNMPGMRNGKPRAYWSCSPDRIKPSGNSMFCWGSHTTPVPPGFNVAVETHVCLLKKDETAHLILVR